MEQKEGEEELYLKGVHLATFRYGELAKIIGIVNFISNELPAFRRPAYKVQYSDGIIDYIAVSEVFNGNHEFVSKTEFEEIKSKNMFMELTTPKMMQSGINHFEEILKKIEQGFKTRVKDHEQYLFSIPNIYVKSIQDKVINAYKAIGWSNVEIKDDIKGQSLRTVIILTR